MAIGIKQIHGSISKDGFYSVIRNGLFNRRNSHYWNELNVHSLKTIYKIFKIHCNLLCLKK